MGKNLIILLFLVSLVSSLALFFLRESSTLRDQLEKDDSSPRLILENFTYYNYENHKVRSTLSGKLGYFIEPNTLEFYGGIRGFRHDSGSEEYFFAESATVRYQIENFGLYFTNSKIDRAEVESGVRIGMSDKIIRTDFAEYIGAENLIRSNLLVNIDSSNGWVKSQDGFKFNVLTKDLILFGPVEGSFQQRKSND